MTNQTLFLYLAVSESAISGALVREDGGVQRPIYYICKSLLNVETKYQRMEKMAISLFVVSRKSKHYFQSFQIIMLKEHSLKSIKENPRPQGEY